jgi:hypothetical protein
MVGADNGPLKQAPYALDAVCVNPTTNPFLRAVVDAVTLRVGILYAKVTGVVIGIYFGRIRLGGLCDEAMQDFLVALLFVLCIQEPS